MLPLLLTSLLAAPQVAPIELREGMAVRGVVSGGRVPVPRDPVWEEIAPKGSSYSPSVSKLTWASVKANADGWFEGVNAGYIWCTFESTAERPLILEATGHGMVYVNGEPRAGDPYGYGYLKLPFLAKRGTNTLLFSSGRGRVKARVVKPAAEQMLDVGDPTLPDVLTTDKAHLFGGVVVLNNSGSPQKGLSIVTSAEGKSVRTAVPLVQPFTFRKVRFSFAPLKKDGSLQLRLVKDGATVSNAELKVAVRKPDQHHKRTFVSEIDGSVQYYAVAPALKPSRQNALVLSVHGASVEAAGQAAAYGLKDWVTVVAATNRRPYGFDWEDWGRLDALEVLAQAERHFPHDPRRVFLTGHSMGGHGTWHIGTLFPDRFGAIAPSAGWLSFWSYGGGWEPREPNAVEKLMRAAMLPSDTLSRMRNLEELGVYILHGDADDNVPVREARAGRDALKDWHKDLNYFEVPGAGHWWSNESVDFPGIFNLFRRRERDLNPKHIRFITPNPAISSRSGWVSIEQVIDPTKPASVDLFRTAVAEDGTFQVSGTTENVAALAFGPGVGSANLDGQFTILLERDILRRVDKKWQREKLAVEWDLTARDAKLIRGEQFPPKTIAGKSSYRGGPFKQAFQNRMVYVYGTTGIAEETAWAYAKSRFDAETFYYRGNGDIEVLSDQQALKTNLRDRNVILVGNSETNSLWKTLLKDSPIEVARGGVKMGGRQVSKGAALFLRPFGDGKRLVGVLAPSVLASGRMLDRMPVFVSGVAYPDWTVFDPEALYEGTKGVAGAGFFGNDWGLKSGTEAWR